MRTPAPFWLAVMLGACSPDAVDRAPDDAPRLAGYVILEQPSPVRALGPDGLELVLAEPPARILAGNAGVYDLLCALVEPERIVGLPARAPAYSLAWAADTVLPADRLVAKLDSETVVGLAPDLAVVHGWQPIEQKLQWRKTGLALIELPDVGRLEDLFETLELLAVLTGERERHAVLRTELEARCAALRERSPGAGRRALAYVNSGTGGWVAGARTTADVVFELVGLENAARTDGRTGHVRIEIEDLLRLDPDVIVVSSSEEGEPGVTRRFLENEPRTQTLRALNGGAVIELPEQLWTSNTHYLVDAAELLAESL